MKIVLPETIVRELEERYAALAQRLNAQAVAIGRDPGVIIEFDPKAKTARMSLKKPRVFRIGPQLLLDSTPEELLNIASHEGGHADITRLGTGFFWKGKQVYRALIGVVEDLRVNARALDRAPGRGEDYREWLKHRYAETFGELASDQLPELLPHEAFLNALMAKTYGGASAWENDPLVGPAIRKAWPSVLKAVAQRPREMYPSEASVARRFARFEKILMEEIKPIYDKLLEKSRERQPEPQEGDGDGTDASGGGVSEDTINERAKRIADALSPNTDDAKDGEGENKTANGSQHGSPQSGQKANGSQNGSAEGSEGTDGGDGGDGGQGSQDGDGSGKNSGSLSDFSKARQHFDDALHKQLAGNTYSDIIHSMSELANRVFAVFDEKLKPNTDHEHDELYSSGSRLDIERAIRAVKGMTSNLNVFHRRTDPDGRDYRFSLLMDASGSMQGGDKEKGGLGLAALFMDVFERLGIPYSLDAFHDSYIPLKGFADDFKAVPKRNAFFNWVKKEIWGRGSTDLRDGVSGSLDRIRKERKTSPKAREFLFVLTDGDENGGGRQTPVRQQCEEAMQEGIIVVGIGIGGGMETVKKHFPIHLVENNPQNLPYLIADFIREYVRQEEEW